MNLLDLAIKITCDDQASKEVDGIGSKITGTLSKAAGIASAIAGSAAVAGVVALGKTALDAYADYEQLVGGIDTLFKSSSDKMQQYASQAYQTAGVSANRYMEISTSFAAALINSLGGDTEAAADMANTAITDMSDNANKMGTSLETVQEAYMSLSRGNYEMLDSLKLGYGGTKTELERLLKDAEKISAAQGEVRDFSVDSYSDIVDAIHLVQDEMGITGTTAEEAASTISGSINMAKGAWDNWLAGLGNEDADMDALTGQLLDSIGTVIDNVGPRVGMIIGTLGMEIANRGPEVAASIRDMLGNAFTSAIDDVLGIVGENTELPTPEFDPTAIMDGVSQAIGFIQELADTFSAVLGPAVELGMQLFDSIGQVIGSVADAVGTYLMPAFEALAPAIASFLTALQPVVEFLTPIIEMIGVGFVQALSFLVDAFTMVIGAIAQVITWVAQFGTFLSTLPQTIGTVVQGIITWFQQLPGNIANFLGMVIANVAIWGASMLSNAISAASGFVSNIINFLSPLPGNIALFLSGIISNVLTWVSQMGQQAANAAAQFANNLINGLASLPGQVVSIGSNIIGGIVQGITGAAGSVVGAITGVVGGAIGAAKNLLGIASPSKVFREIGRFSMQGMALGVDDGADLVTGSTDAAMRGMIDSARDAEVPAATAAAGTPANTLIEEVRKLREDIRNMKIYLNGRTLVGGIADDMDREFGRRAAWSATR